MRDHGTYACYVWGPEPGCLPGRGCRCDDCKAAVRAKAAADRRRTAPAYVGADRARSHVRWLADNGVGLKTLAKASGVSHGALSKLMFGVGDRPPSRRIRPATEQAILAVRPDAAAADGAYVPAERFHDTLDTLHARGWTNASVSRAIGCTATNLLPRGPRVTAGRLRALRALLDQDVPIPPNRTGRNARAFELAVAWNGRDLDAEKRDELRRAAQAEERAAYRAKAKAAVDDLPTLDLAALAAQGWRDRAACRLVPDGERWIFWPGKGDHQAIAAARTVCTSCPVADECVAHAVAALEHGVWAGTTDRERQHMRMGRIPVAPNLNPRPADKRRPCGHCGELFLPWAATTRYCSRSCAMRARGGLRLVAS